MIAANVLTAKPGELIIVDEPERHLHRSIISPLLSLLLTKRPDCAFVISTHDVLLPIDNPNAHILLLRGCAFSGSNVSAWHADLVPSGTQIDNDIKEDILGSRSKLLFVEGDEASLDKPLYSLLFPSVSVIAKSNCRDVEHAVTAIRSAENLHWINSFGIVDNDGRTDDDVAKLKANGVYALPVFSVESIYYHPFIQRRAAQRQSNITGDDARARIASAKAAAIASVTPHVKRLSERAAESGIRAEVFRHLPKREDVALGEPINISIDISASVAKELARLQEALNRGDLDPVISHYPIRETPALDIIAKGLGFQGRSQYESASESY